MYVWCLSCADFCAFSGWLRHLHHLGGKSLSPPAAYRILVFAHFHQAYGGRLMGGRIVIRSAALAALRASSSGDRTAAAATPVTTMVNSADMRRQAVRTCRPYRHRAPKANVVVGGEPALLLVLLLLSKLGAHGEMPNSSATTYSTAAVHSRVQR